MGSERSSERRPDERFGDKAEAYAQFRPTYPPALADWLAEQVPLTRGSVIADVGAGTGLSTRLFLGRGWSVWAIEPNAPMREAARRELGDVAGLQVAAGSGEAVPLPDASVDLVAIAQALHWFDLDRARDELRRVLKPSGRVAVLYNTRDATSGFAGAIEAAFSRYAPERDSVGHIGPARDRRIAELFRGGSYQVRELRHLQRLSWEGVRGWLASISYLPAAGAPERTALEGELATAFEHHATGGLVDIEYIASVHLGSLGR